MIECSFGEFNNNIKKMNEVKEGSARDRLSSLSPNAKKVVVSDFKEAMGRLRDIVNVDCPEFKEALANAIIDRRESYMFIGESK
jgi:hypothetical protein